MKIRIDNNEYEASEKETILDVCRREGIKIPTLCHMKGVHEGVCRICLVENSGKLMTSCNTKACPQMDIVTQSENISRARKINLELLWADHAGKCATCKKNRRCELQNLTMLQKVENFRFVPKKEDLTQEEELDLLKDNRMRVVVDEGNSAISRTTELCVECRRCINICPTKELSFNNRSGDVVVGTPYQKPLDCIFCGQCVKNCPTGGITDKNDLDEILEKLDDPKKMAVALFDPALLESMSLEQPEIESQRKLVGTLKAVGFEAVFDLAFGMEIFIEKTIEKIKGNQSNNLILSHCPSLKLYIEKYFPEFSKNIIDVLTPDELMAIFVKTEYAKKNKINPKDIVVVSISSCVAKKIKKDTSLDYVITMREFGRIIRKKNIKISEVEGEEFSRDISPKNKEVSKMTRCGGAAEMIAREMGIEYIQANGVKDIKNIFISLRKKRIETKIIEAMICPGGCVGGGGQSNNIL
ncbi:MAG TPA: hypothetical protein DIC35_00815 [Candidatus Moranbacteria bacterium]|nr:hypothetical protein [Candidatus Moranbacteria bacterium]